MRGNEDVCDIVAEHAKGWRFSKNTTEFKCSMLLESRHIKKGTVEKHVHTHTPYLLCLRLEAEQVAVNMKVDPDQEGRPGWRWFFWGGAIVARTCFSAPRRMSVLSGPASFWPCSTPFNRKMLSQMFF